MHAMKARTAAAEVPAPGDNVMCHTAAAAVLMSEFQAMALQAVLYAGSNAPWWDSGAYSDHLAVHQHDERQHLLSGAPAQPSCARQEAVLSDKQNERCLLDSSARVLTPAAFETLRTDGRCDNRSVASSLDSTEYMVLHVEDVSFPEEDDFEVVD
mmetsp:Transcript_9245/g.16220  ORF Transcript_9245/g.16220 Transcript_9245/m.16220 type:complete len:155 (-) Transcript_9245:66-530(-)